MDQQLAVYVKNANKNYNSQRVLHDFTMRVPKGIIYGLLGASGCGKTTLLNSVVGSQNLDSGQVYILGQNIKFKRIKYSNIGFMPQEVALASEFTIKEAINYFGIIFGLSKNKINERFLKLSILLSLPTESKLIKECSGGEQRRVSFAAALINNPKILILDEPTVGLDPILREVLWTYLIELAKLQDTAVIITTHYIEEAVKAHKVGFMRQGKLLAEDSPKNFLTSYRTNSLEQVFLLLSKNQNCAINNENNNDRSVTLPNSINATNVSEVEKRPNRAEYYKNMVKELKLNVNRLKALFSKNYIQFSRNTSGVFITFLIPVLTLIFLLTAIGNELTNVKVAVVNDELKTNHSCSNQKLSTTITDTGTCEIKNLSCNFIEALQDSMLDKVDYINLDDALDALKFGKIWAVLFIPSNFSISFQERIRLGYHIQDDVLNSSQIIAWVDVSNKQIGASIKHKLSTQILKLQETVLKACDYQESTFDSLVRIKNVYSEKDDSFKSFLIPGMLLTLTFFMSVTNTVDTIITDKLQGTWHRSSVAGVSSLEIILTHFVTQFLIVLVQILEIIILTFFIYKTEYEGSLFNIMLFLVVGSMCGMSYGFWISVVSENYSVANFLTTGSFYPLVLISGVIWPLEGMPKILQYCAFGLPIALPTISIRNIMKKGWSLTNFEVLNAFGVQIFWITLLAIICVYKLKK